jgi:hypothetical protein
MSRFLLLLCVCTSTFFAAVYADSTDFPLKGVQQADQPERVTCVTKSATSGVVVSSTYLGGSGSDAGWDIAVESTGVHVTRSTDSTNFPTKNSIFPGSMTGGFVTKLTLAGDYFAYSTYLGGPDSDYPIAISVDSAAWLPAVPIPEIF